MTTEKWQNRIVGTGVVDAGSLLANEANWRIHSKAQQSALSGVLGEVGWVQDCIVNLRTSEQWGVSQGVETVVDGHARINLALRQGDETPVPVTYVDLTPGEEALVLATLDPLSAMASADKEKLDALLRDVATGSEAVQAMLAELGAKAGLYPIDPTAEWQGMPEFEQEDKTAFQSIHVHFKTQADVEAFAELIVQKIGPKTRALWYPEAEQLDLSSELYRDES